MASKQNSKETDKKQKQANQDEAKEQKSGKHEQQGSSKAIAGDAGDEADSSQELDELIETLNGDLSAVEPEAALDIVEQWHGLLNKAKEPELKEIASSLKQLQKLLKSGKAEAHEIGEVLEQLGEQTSDCASAADKGAKNTLQKLGKQLTKVGASINKADNQEHLDDLNSLVETLDGEELTSLNSEDSTAAIDMWYGMVNKAEGDQFKELASGLKELKQVLKRSKAKPEEIAEVLSRLGEQTVEISSEAPRGFKTVVQKLGKRLSKAAKAIAPAE
jgi:septal ring factor EnvC (AmiA/AmiB activator)